jgi:uncharacterized membrane protein
MSSEVMNHTSSLNSTTAKIRRVENLADPFKWLGAGVLSFAAAPGASLLYGAVFALGAAGTLYLSWTLPGFTVAFITGLLLIGPLLAAGLYVAARQQENGEPVEIGAAIRFLGSRSANLGLYAVFLALIMAAWVRFSALLFALKFSSFSISVDGYLGILSGTGDPVAVAYFVLVGLLLALTVFITSAVAIPMIVDRDCGPITAIQASARAFAANWPAMLLWAALIVALTAIGIATFFVGMVVLFPVLAYATWHSYKALVG